MNSCKGCKYLGSDCGYDCMWYVCDHPNATKDCPESNLGRGLEPDLEKPKWCPLND